MNANKVISNYIHTLGNFNAHKSGITVSLQKRGNSSQTRNNTSCQTNGTSLKNGHGAYNHDHNTNSSLKGKGVVRRTLFKHSNRNLTSKIVLIGTIIRYNKDRSTNTQHINMLNYRAKSSQYGSTSFCMTVEMPAEYRSHVSFIECRRIVGDSPG